jgi:hypothetical protein
VGRLVDEQAASRIAALIGLGGSVAPEESPGPSAASEARAEEGPLVLAVDLHWAEPTLLELLAGLSKPAQRLYSAGRRARQRGDVPAAAKLLQGPPTLRRRRLRRVPGASSD